ncbi:MAG: SUMF1/EgtB/PvdO family nonheme iron enzyme [Nannocystaceae bacterium]
MTAPATPQPSAARRPLRRAAAALLRGLRGLAIAAPLTACAPYQTADLAEIAEPRLLVDAEQELRWPELPVVGDGAGKADNVAGEAAIVIDLSTYATLPPRPGGSANADAWIRYFREVRGIPEARIFALRGKKAHNLAIIDAIREAGNITRTDGQLWIIFIGYAVTELGEDGEPLLLTHGASAEGPLDDHHYVSVPLVYHLLIDTAQAPTFLVIDACGPPGARYDAPVLGGVETHLYGPSTEVMVAFRTKFEGAPPIWGTRRGIEGAVISAGLGDRCVATLPGDGRPALSYWLLGALQGWTYNTRRTLNADALVAGVLDFASVIAADIVDSRQPLPPKILGQGRANLRLARDARQPKPTLTDLTGERDDPNSPLVFAGGARITRPEVSRRWPEVSDTARAQLQPLLDEARSPTLDPEALADAWCPLRANDTKLDALLTQECQRWRRYALRWRAFHIILDQDHATLRRFLLRKGEALGLAALRDFVRVYAEFPTHPRIRAAQAALTAHAAGDARWRELAAFGDAAAIPRGRYFRGCTDRDAHCEDDETPQLRRVSAFLLDRREVSRRDYDHCVFAGGCEAVEYSECFSWSGDGFSRGGALPSAFWGDDAPQVCVPHEHARRYCEWLGKRLPTEFEWEVAARGGDRRIYPWGDAPPTCEEANHAECGSAPQRVDSPGYAGPRGLQHMAGNVSEWVQDWYVEHYRFSRQRNPRGPVNDRRLRSIRGGSFYDPPEFLRASYRYAMTPRFGYATVGFRCAARR